MTAHLPHPFNMEILFSTLQPILLFKSTENAAFRYKVDYNVVQPAFCRIIVKLEPRRGQAPVVITAAAFKNWCAQWRRRVFMCNKQ